MLGSDGIILILKSLKKDHRLRKLDISNNCFEDDAACEIAKILEENVNLQILSISTFAILLKIEENYFGPIGGSVIAQALRTNNTLKKLNISKVKIGIEGGSYIADSLKVNRSLINLNLSIFNNAICIDRADIMDEGARKIGEALKVNNTLEKLILSENKITCVKEIADSLKINSSLKVLFLSLNALADSEALRFASVLSQTKALKLLDLSITTKIIY